MGSGGGREVDGEPAFMITSPGLRGEVTGSAEIPFDKALFSGTMRGGYFQVHSISLSGLDHRLHVARGRSVHFFASAQIHKVTARLAGTRRCALWVRAPPYILTSRTRSEPGSFRK